MSARKSLVQSTYQPTGPVLSKCGYCKSENTFMVESVWALRLTCQDYQDLVDRGFQRSGKFVYRPVMKETCCPQYVFRTDVTNFKPNKSQRYALRKFKRFLVEGRPDVVVEPKTDHDMCNRVDLTPPDVATTQAVRPGTPTRKNKEVKPGLGPDPNKPLAQKAKDIRKQKRRQKALSKCTTPVSMASSRSSPVPQLVDYPLDDLISVSLPNSDECKHKFECRLVQVSPPSQMYTDSAEESFQVFVKFQMTIHKEKEEDCTIRIYRDFIEQSPLLPMEGSPGMPCGYGTFHQQYLIDGKLFAVGVLDILPRGVLCEYFYYDPAYRFLAPGVCGAMNEIALTQQMYKVTPSIQYYYMGYYVQSCPKMNYKSQYSASSLLCPETYTYVPLQLCVPKLISSGYSRLAEDSVSTVVENVTQEELDLLPVFSLMHASEQPEYQDMTYREFKALYGDIRKRMIEDYARIAGLEVAMRMTIYLSC